MLLNLASVVNADAPEVLWGFVRRYSPGASAEKMPFLARLVDHAIRYYRDFVRPKKHYRAPSSMERDALEDLAVALAALPEGADAETVQAVIFAVGKRHPFNELRAWFSCLYELLLGQSEGPRFGAFAAIYGVPETIGLIRTALARRSDICQAEAT
jgi:lysyl-tRNA synthetase class 1